jgi:hypothetical protein
MNSTQESGFPPAAGIHEEQSYSLVLICGFITTALALLGIYVLDTNVKDFHIMGLYADYVLPAGAVIVGVAASSGYGLASWFGGIKITRKLLWIILTLQLVAYFAAQYIEFDSLHLVHRDGRPVGFFEYYDLVARSFAWKQSDGSMGQPLGVRGYFLRGLDVIGFAAGGLIIPVLLRKAPYCPGCQLYMKTWQLGLVPASVPVKKVKKSDAAGKAAYDAEQQKAFDVGKQTLATLQQFATGDNTAEFQKKVEELQLGKKQAGKLPGRFSLRLIHCKRCYSGQFVAKLLLGQGKQMKQSEFSRTELHSEFVRSVDH